MKTSYFFGLAMILSVLSEKEYFGQYLTESRA